MSVVRRDPSHCFGAVPLPPLPDDLEWLNVVRPLRREDFHGRLLIVHFWARSSVASRISAVELRRLEHRFGPRLAVLGVHCPRFSGERPLASVRAAVEQLALQYPIVNDLALEFATAVGVVTRPTLLFVDPRGNVFAKHEGHVDAARFAPVVEEALGVYNESGLLASTTPLPLQPERLPLGPLSHPARVAVHPDGKRLAIADTGHGRVVVARLDGQVTAVHDGLGSPGGLGYSANGDLFITDIGRHTLERLSATGALTRLAGTGEVGHDVESMEAGALRQPSDVAVHGAHAIVAMAGVNSLWRWEETGGLVPWSGSGEEGLADGPAAGAWYAEPAGLALGPLSGRLAVADAQTSALRWVDGGSGSAATLLGRGLHDFGDADGPADVALLQYPGGVAVDAGGNVIVADTLNHRVKLFDLATRRLVSLAGTGRRGDADGAHDAAEFNEPGGVAADARHVYVADTGNHRVRVIDRHTGSVTTLELQGL